MKTKTPEQINELLRVARKMSNGALAEIAKESQKQPRCSLRIEELKYAMTIAQATIIALEWVLAPPDSLPTNNYFSRK